MDAIREAYSKLQATSIEHILARLARHRTHLHCLWPQLDIVCKPRPKFSRAIFYHFRLEPKLSHNINRESKDRVD